jgi:hypothetical protein
MAGADGSEKPSDLRGEEMTEQLELRFDGATIDAGLDTARLAAQHHRVFDIMRLGTWATLAEISQATGDPEASVSARLRDFRKERFGAHTVERRRRGEPDAGLFEYRMILNWKARK